MRVDSSPVSEGVLRSNVDWTDRVGFGPAPTSSRRVRGGSGGHRPECRAGEPSGR